jgi:hypothetical protein
MYCDTLCSSDPPAWGSLLHSFSSLLSCTYWQHQTRRRELSIHPDYLP